MDYYCNKCTEVVKLNYITCQYMLHEITMKSFKKNKKNNMLYSQEHYSLYYSDNYTQFQHLFSPFTRVSLTSGSLSHHLALCLRIVMDLSKFAHTL